MQGRAITVRDEIERLGTVWRAEALAPDGRAKSSSGGWPRRYGRTMAGSLRRILWRSAKASAEDPGSNA
jgi:hypothetical protein